MTCSICNNIAVERLKKGVVQYYQCTNCRTLFSGPLDNDNMVGGGNEEQRNVQQNQERIDRIASLTHGKKKEDVHILDFGAGHGYLVKDLKDVGYINTVAYDAYNPAFSRLPEKNKFDVCIAVEVIEHTAYPYAEIDAIRRSMKEGAMLIVETSFVDIAAEDGIELESFFYIEPKVGHSTIFSYHGLDLLMVKNGFSVCQVFNRNVHLYQKK